MNIFGKHFLDSLYWPVFGSIFLVIWTAIVYPFSNYGDYWALLPELSVFPTVLVIHIVLIVKGKGQAKLILYGVGHVSLLSFIWILCLMLISKDSL